MRPALAQDPTVAVFDSTLADSLPPVDTVPAGAQARLATAEPVVPVGPLPPGTRYTFTRDSILWMTGVTLADLLVTIPGVYVARAGFLGQPEYIMYGGRGGASLELYWDGLPLEPLGRDSIHHDAGRVNLTYVDRVDVHVLPSTLRVYLVSTRHASLEPRSALRVMTGYYGTGAYAGLFQKNMPNGVGFNVAADFVGTDETSGTEGTNRTFDVWARVDWHSSGLSGASYQVRRQNHSRDAVGSNVAGREGNRTDFLFTMFSGARPDGLGLRVEGRLAASAWTGDSSVLDQRVRSARAAVRYVRPNWSAGVSGVLGEARTTSGVLAQFGWAPSPGVALSGEAQWARHDGNRSSVRAHGAVGLYGGPFSLAGTLQYQDAVQAPSILGDSAQRTLDHSVQAGFATQPVSGHVALLRRDAYLPLAFPELGVISGFDTSSAATYLVADVRLASSRALALDAWYSAPVSGGRGAESLPQEKPRQAADLQPPHHGRVQITYRSKFWRTFRSGAFDLKVQIALEYWSTGDAGFDAHGSPIALKGATFYEGFVQFQIEDFVGFWDMRNAYNSPDPYIPGLSYPKAVQTFGVKWEFSN